MSCDQLQKRETHRGNSQSEVGTKREADNLVIEVIDMKRPRTIVQSVFSPLHLLILVITINMSFVIGNNIDKSNDLINEEITSKIINGSRIRLSILPYSVFLAAGRNSGECTGILVSHHYILTAAHCHSHNDLTAFVGHRKKYKGKRYYQDQFHRHPYISQIFHDIGLIHVNESIEFTKKVRPAVLAVPGDVFPPGTTCVIAGYGHIRTSKPSRGLRYGEMVIKPPAFCTDSRTIHPLTQLCLAPTGSTHVTINYGDSGSGLLCPRNGQLYDRPVLAGVASYTGKGFAVYSRVSQFQPWINSYISSADQ